MIQMTINVLIIEKKEDNYLLMCNLFKGLGDRDFNFIWKRDCENLEDLLQKNEVDYCLVNDQMFSKNEYNLLRNNQSLSGMLTIALSGFDENAIKANIYVSNSSEYLIKGQFSREALNNIVHYAVKNNEMRKRIHSEANSVKTGEENFLSIANNNLDGLLVLDENGTVLYGNPAAGVLYDCSSKELTGRQLGIPITSDKVAILDLVRKDGEACVVEARFTNVEWANQAAYLVSLRDITEQERIITSLREASIYDELTGLYNRREANRLLNDEIEYCKRYKNKTSLMMFDIDSFKKINDTYGHVAGDNALKWISKIVTSQIRLVDKLARFGGDEFIILLPSTSGTSALIPARRICTKIAGQLCSLLVNKTERVDLKITISLGITEIPDYGDSVDSAIHMVDLALYKAKDLGGNCAFLYHPGIENRN